MHRDQSFKNLILDYPHEALAFFAAEEAGALDTSVRVVPLRQEQLQECLGERFRELDVPLLVEWRDGRRAALVFIIGVSNVGWVEQSETQHVGAGGDAGIPLRCIPAYGLDLAELAGTERVVPVVIFLRAGGARRRLELAGSRNTYLAFTYLACALAAEPAARHVDSANLVAWVNLPNMAHSREARVQLYGAALQGLLALERDVDKQKNAAAAGLPRRFQMRTSVSTRLSSRQLSPLSQSPHPGVHVVAAVLP